MALFTPAFTPSFSGDAYQVLNGQPDCGWYNIAGYELGDAFSSDALNNLTWDDETSVTTDLVEINLKSYADRDIDETALSQFDYILSQYREKKHSVILRLLYDWDGKSFDTEPRSIGIVYSHLASLAPVINSYKDTVFVCQGILLGDVGEMHGSYLLTEKRMRQIPERMAELIDKDIYLSVRTPAQRRYIVSTMEPLKEAEAFRGTLNSRMGLFNDGIFGSEIDLGTYGDTSIKKAKDLNAKGTRAEETDYQNSLCRYVPNGGEAGGYSNYSDMPRAFRELKKIHFSYMNRGYSEEVINKWKNTVFSVPGTGISTDGYTAVGLFLGYRPEVTSVKSALDGFLLVDEVISIRLVNRGFAPIYRPATATLTLTGPDGATQSLTESIDLKTFAKDGAVTLRFTMKNSSLQSGISQLRLSVTSDLSGRPILLANSGADASGLGLGTLQKR